MTARPYPFRDDDGNIIYVDFDTMMGMDGMGFLKIGGTMTRRARDLEDKPVTTQGEVNHQVDHVSDSLGFTKSCLKGMIGQLETSGVKGIEFVEDPDVPNFYQVHASSKEAKLKYAKSRQFRDQTATDLAVLGPYDLKCAQEMVQRQHVAKPRTSLVT